MKDPRITKLAKTLVEYSVDVKPGENVLIEFTDSGEELAAEIIKEVYNHEGKPFLSVDNTRLTKQLILGMNEQQAAQMAHYEIERMNDMHAWIGFSGKYNSSEMAGIPDEKMKISDAKWDQPVLDVRLKKKWVVTRYPTPAMAQKAGMSTEQFEDFFFDVCTVDYKKMSNAMEPLVELMKKTDKVRIVGKDTDLTFSIKGMPAIKCDGKHNVPDGEIYTAPVKDSVNGHITYNTPSQNRGCTYENIRLEFKDGKIVNATANDTKKLNEILDTDEGARYVGEFAIGVNPYVTKPMNEILFDEKIAGSFHFTPGMSYDNCPNGNKSAVHWDLVMVQTPEYGGGKIYFDDVLIRENGRFVLKELEGLNPENLKGN